MFYPELRATTQAAMMIATPILDFSFSAFWCAAKREKSHDENGQENQGPSLNLIIFFPFISSFST